MTTSVYFEVNDRTGRIQLKRRTWDGIESPFHETLYTIETIAEANALYRDFGSTIDSAKERDKEWRSKRIEELRVKVAALSAEKESLERQMEEISRP